MNIEKIINNTKGFNQAIKSIGLIKLYELNEIDNLYKAIGNLDNPKKYKWKRNLKKSLMTLDK